MAMASQNAQRVFRTDFNLFEVGVLDVDGLAGHERNRFGVNFWRGGRLAQVFRDTLPSQGARVGRSGCIRRGFCGMYYRCACWLWLSSGRDRLSRLRGYWNVWTDHPGGFNSAFNCGQKNVHCGKHEEQAASENYSAFHGVNCSTGKGAWL